MKVRDIRRRAYPKRGYHNIGKRCPEDYPGCVNCDAWHFFDTRGRFPYSFDEMWANKRKDKP